MRGSKPASWQERRKIEASGHEPVVPRIQFSSASSSSLRPRLRASGWLLGSATYIGSSSRCRRSMPSSAGGSEGGADVQGDVDVAAAQLGDRRARLGWLERQLDSGMALAIAGDRLGHDRRARAREGGEPQPAAAQAGDGLELGLGVGEPREDDVGVLDQRAARVGQPDAARAALDEHHAGLALQGGDLLGDGRLRVVQRVGGGGERATCGDLAQHAHAANVKH